MKRLLDKIDLTEEQTENILEQISIHCFQEGIEIEQFLAQIDEVAQIAHNLDATISDIPEIIKKRKLELANLEKQISFMTRKISRLGINVEVQRRTEQF